MWAPRSGICWGTRETGAGVSHQREGTMIGQIYQFPEDKNP